MTTMSMRWVSSVALVAALGCSARGGGGGGFVGANDGGGGGGFDAPPAADCASICARLRGVPGCSEPSVSACVSGCQALGNPPAACRAATSALLACAATAQPSCTSGSFPFVGCEAQLAAVSTCVGQLASDGGLPQLPDVVITPDRPSADECATALECGSCTARSSCGWCAGRCWTGSGSGPSAGSCGGDRWAWTTSQCSAPVVDSGINNPLISPGCQSCATAACTSAVGPCLADSACVACLSSALTPACRANPNVAAILSCACGGCRSACTSECASLGL